jgi:hypothetical protein
MRATASENHVSLAYKGKNLKMFGKYIALNASGFMHFDVKCGL